MAATNPLGLERVGNPYHSKKVTVSAVSGTMASNVIVDRILLPYQHPSACVLVPFANACLAALLRLLHATPKASVNG